MSRRLLEAALESARTTVALLEAELAATDETRWATPSDNPFNSEYTFRRLCRSGEIPCVRGVRGQYRARWADVAEWMARQKFEPTKNGRASREAALSEPPTGAVRNRNTPAVDALDELVASGAVREMHAH